MKYILILLLLLQTSYATQSDYSIIVEKPFGEVLLDVTQDYDRQISAVGFSRSYKISSKNYSQAYSDPFEYLESISNNSHGSQIHLIRADEKANITLSKSTKLDDFNEAVTVVKTDDNGYFIGGYTHSGSLVILKVDSNGNILFRKLFGTKNYDNMNNLLLLKDGGVLAIGTSRTTRSKDDKLFESGLGLNDIYITRFTKNGDMLWSKKYGTEYDDKGIDVCEAYDGSIIVLGSTRHGNQHKIIFMRINENGEKLWIKYNESQDSIMAHRIIKLRDSNFLVSLSKKENLANEQIKLVKFDIHQNILLDKTIYTTYSSALKDIKEYSNGNIIGVGYVNDSYNTDALVMLLNKDLKLLTQEHYGEDNYDTFNAVKILHNSQAVAVGAKTHNNLQASNMWIVKLNLDGTMAQKSSDISGLYERLMVIFRKEIDSAQLIIKKDLTIDFIATDLYFKVAQYKLTKRQKDFLVKFSNKLIPVLKEYQASIDTLEINGHTSSEWGETNFTNRYLYNEKLSMNRSYSTLEFMFKSQTREIQDYLTDIFKGSGSSYAKRVFYNERENKEKSRRVSFKIILNDT